MTAKLSDDFKLPLKTQFWKHDNNYYHSKLHFYSVIPIITIQAKKIWNLWKISIERRRKTRTSYLQKVYLNEKKCCPMQKIANIHGQ